MPGATHSAAGGAISARGKPARATGGAKLPAAPGPPVVSDGAAHGRDREESSKVPETVDDGAPQQRGAALPPPTQSVSPTLPGDAPGVAAGAVTPGECCICCRALVAARAAWVMHRSRPFFSRCMSVWMCNRRVAGAAGGTELREAARRPARAADAGQQRRGGARRQQGGETLLPHPAGAAVAADAQPRGHRAAPRAPRLRAPRRVGFVGECAAGVRAFGRRMRVSGAAVTDTTPPFNRGFVFACRNGAASAVVGCSLCFCFRPLCCTRLSTKQGPSAGGAAGEAAARRGEGPLLRCLLLSGSHAVREAAVRLTNVLASDAAGRRYLLGDAIGPDGRRAPRRSGSGALRLSVT